MSRNILWRELKKLNPKTSQQWPSVSVNSIKAEINKINKSNEVKLSRPLLWKQLKSLN